MAENSNLENNFELLAMKGGEIFMQGAILDAASIRKQLLISISSFFFLIFFISNKGPGLYSGEKGIKSTYFSGFCHLGPKFHIVFTMYCISIVRNVKFIDSKYLAGNVIRHYTK